MYGVKWCRIIAAICAVFVPVAFAAPAVAASASDDRVRALEAENRAILEELSVQRDRIEELEADFEAETAEAVPEVPSVDSEDGLFAVKGKFPMRLSGFIKGDMLWNDARMNSTSAPRFVRSEGKSGDDQFTTTVQHSRLGLRIGDIDLGSDVKIRGYAEMDFFNLSDTGDTNYNNNQLRVRQLYGRLSFDGWEVLAGQTWDLFSPLNAATLNTNGNYWLGGNAGFRRPQLQVAKNVDLASDQVLRIAGSVSSNIGVTVVDAGRTLNSGRDSGIPVFEGLVEYRFPMPAGTARIGASGLWGQEDVDGVRNNVDQWAVGGHMVLPVHDRLTVQVEYHHGENTDAFLTGGGINPTTGKEIESDSGYVQAIVKANDRLTFTGLFGINDLDESDLPTGSLKSNLVTGVNAKYKLFAPVTVGVEYTYFDSRYVGSANENAHLMWVSASFNF